MDATPDMTFLCDQADMRARDSWDMLLDEEVRQLIESRADGHQDVAVSLLAAQLVVAIEDEPSTLMDFALAFVHGLRKAALEKLATQ